MDVNEICSLKHKISKIVSVEFSLWQIHFSKLHIKNIYSFFFRMIMNITVNKNDGYGNNLAKHDNGEME